MMRIEKLGRFTASVLLAAALLTVPGCTASGADSAPSAAQYSNPIISGDWSDPGLIRVGGDYYSVRSSFGWQPGLPIVHSKDLIHWEYIGHGFTTHPKLLPGDTRYGIWGVEMGYNPNTKQFLIYAPTREGDIYVYNSDKPEGPYQSKLLGANLGIDPGFFHDDDGRLYLIANKRVIHELTPDGLSVKRQVGTVNGSSRYFEGPDIFKHGGWYYLLYSDGGTLPHEPSTISTLRAKTLEGPWEADPNNPNMFSTDNHARFEAPAHGTLIDTPGGQWYLTYHAHETAYYSLGRQFLMEPIEWTADGWWKPVHGKVPSLTAEAPDLPQTDYHLAQSDEFDSPKLGLQWFFTCPPDMTGTAWSLTQKPGDLIIRTQPGDLGSITALPAIFQQRVIDKLFTFETKLTFDAKDGAEAAGLQMYHDPEMNFALASTVSGGEKRITVTKYNLGVKKQWTATSNPVGSTVYLKIVVDGEESATCYFGPDGKTWRQVGGAIYFGASGHHLRNNMRGDPDLGWVGRYKDATATAAQINARNPALPNRSGNVWTAATFGLFAIRDGATASRDADFEYFYVSHPASISDAVH